MLAAVGLDKLDLPCCSQEDEVVCGNRCPRFAQF